MQLSKTNKLRIRLEIYEERFQETQGRCENPDCHRPASDLHHGCIRDLKRLKKVLFTKFNLIMLCRECNCSKMYDNEAGRQHWWDIQVKRYGLFAMLKWLGEVNRQCIIPFVFK